MAGAYNADRPYADIVVFKESGQWYVRLALKPMGPRPSKTGAIGWGFAFFALSSAAWIAAGLVMRVRSLVMVNTVLLLTNLIGIYRWLLA